MELTKLSNLETSSLQELIQSKWINNKGEAVIYLINNTQALSVFDHKEQKLKLTDLLLEWRMMVGVNEDATANEMTLNINWILEEYSAFTPEKIREAYKSSLKGLLSDDRGKPLDIKPYGKFSPMYISMVLNAFIEYERPIIRKVLQNKSEFDREQRDMAEKVSSRRSYIEYYLSKVNTNCMEERFVKMNYIMHNFLYRNDIIEECDFSEDVSKDDVLVFYPDHYKQKIFNTVPSIYGSVSESILIYKHLAKWFLENTINYSKVTDEQILYDYD